METSPEDEQWGRVVGTSSGDEQREPVLSTDLRYTGRGSALARDVSVQGTKRSPEYCCGGCSYVVQAVPLVRRIMDEVVRHQYRVA